MLCACLTNAARSLWCCAAVLSLWSGAAHAAHFANIPAHSKFNIGGGGTVPAIDTVVSSVAADSEPAGVAVNPVGIPPLYTLQARIVAVGIPGIGGLRQVGMFHAGGAIPSNPEFLTQTREGRALFPERLLVTSQSNFGLPPAKAGFAPGAVLSLDPRTTEPLLIPPDFAKKSPATLDGRVMLFSAQSKDFLNGYYNGQARTARMPAISNPRYVSVNNAFGRPWFASAPMGPSGPAMSSVLDPDGRPLDNAPSLESGGVFAAEASNRVRGAYARDLFGRSALGNLYRSVFPEARSDVKGQYTAGNLSSGGLGTAFMGASPDATGFAVFAVALADGSVAQVHVQDGVDGLAGPNTIMPHKDANGLVGIAFKWNPDRALYLADQFGNRIAVLNLDNDATHFRLKGTRYLSSAYFNQPVDLAAALPEIANPRFASHTTLSGGSDLFVANRGDGVLLRLSQTGAVLARARIAVPGLGIVGPAAIQAVAVSADAQKIWISLTGPVPQYPDRAGVVIEVGAFDAQGSYAAKQPAADGGLPAQGAALFAKQFTPAEGLGPLFNARSCLECHDEPTPGGGSTKEANFATRVARVHPVTGRLQPLDGLNAPVARTHSLREFGFSNAPAAGVPRQTNVISSRMPPALYGIALADRIPAEAILANAVGKGDGIHGRPNYVKTRDGLKIGRYGWKADKDSLEHMVANAFSSELGLSNPHTVQTELAGREAARFDIDANTVKAVAAYLRTLTRPDAEVSK